MSIEINNEVTGTTGTNELALAENYISEASEMLDQLGQPELQISEEELAQRDREEDQMRVTNDLLFTDLVVYLKEQKPELVNSYCLWGISDGIARIANLFDAIAPNNPELASSFAEIGIAVAKIGKEMAEKQEASEEILNIELTQEHIQSIKERINIIDVDLPDHLKD